MALIQRAYFLFRHIEMVPNAFLSNVKRNGRNRWFRLFYRYFRQFIFESVVHLWHLNYQNGIDETKIARDWQLQYQDHKQNSHFEPFFRLYWRKSVRKAGIHFWSVLKQYWVRQLQNCRAFFFQYENLLCQLGRQFLTGNIFQTESFIEMTLTSKYNIIWRIALNTFPT